MGIICIHALHFKKPVFRNRIAHQTKNEAKCELFACIKLTVIVSKTCNVQYAGWNEHCQLVIWKIIEKSIRT